MIRILFADNAGDFLDTRAEFLERAGYRVIKAYNLEQARQRLADDHVHLAILDIRMYDDNDERDTSGLTLARDPAYRPVPKIILTNFPTFKAVREALGPALDGLPPAVDFLDKREGPDAMIRSVEQAIENYVRINWDLEILWDAQEHISFLCLAGLLQTGLPDKHVVRRAGELEDLFRQMFRDYLQLRIVQLFWHGGGRLGLSILARSAQGTTDARIVVCGEREQLAQEAERVQGIAPETLHGIRLDEACETMHFGAIAYGLPDADLETVRPLRALFQNGKERPLKAAFNHLLKEILPTWHKRGQMPAAQQLKACYARMGLGENGLPHPMVEQRADALAQLIRPFVDVQRSNDLVTFRFPSHPPQVYPDPLVSVYGSLDRYGSADLGFMSPGLLTIDNILVDEAQRTWLADLEKAGQMPPWWDFVSLEAMVRFDVGQAPDLLAWLEFEECLTQQVQLRDRLQAQEVVSRLKPSVVLIEQIRHQAAREIGPDVLPYYAGLLAWTVGAISQYLPGKLYTQAEIMRGGHLLLAAAMLGKCIQELIETRDQKNASEEDQLLHGVSGALLLDEDGVTVRIGPKQCESLSDDELKLFRCLYDQAGHVVLRKVLVKAVYDEKHDAADKHQERRLNALVSRLRKKIEPIPGRSRYIYTIRGQGYRLETGEKDAN